MDLIGEVALAVVAVALAFFVAGMVAGAALVAMFG